MLAELDVKNIEVSGEAVMAFTQGLPDYLIDITKTIFYHYNISDPKPNDWYCLEDNIMVLDEMQQKFGKSILYEIGKSVVNIIKLKNEPKTLKDALEMLEKQINIVHKNGSVCELEIVKINLRRRKIILKIEIPYHAELMRGVLTGLARKYTPNSNILADVEIDEEKSNYPLAYYKIIW